MFLNGLETFFRNLNVEGVQCNQHPKDDDLTLYFKIFNLLYADDTVIHNSSAEGLQTAMNMYAEYCHN